MYIVRAVRACFCCLAVSGGDLVYCTTRLGLGWEENVSESGSGRLMSLSAADLGMSVGGLCDPHCLVSWLAIASEMGCVLCAGVTRIDRHRSAALVDSVIAISSPK